MAEIEIDKRLVRERFERSFAKHPDAAVVQSRMADRLVALLCEHASSSSSSHVLELGCGAATLAPALVARFSVDCWVANDLAAVEDILKRAVAHLHLKQVDFLHGDMECLDLPDGQDMIVSNAAFQWLALPAAFFSRLVGKLAPGGVLAFSSFGPENLREIRALTGASLDYLPLSAYASMLREAGEMLCLDSGLQTVVFDSPEAVLRHLSQTGVNALSRARWTRAELRNFVASYRSQFSTGDAVELTYQPVYVIFKRAEDISS